MTVDSRALLPLFCWQALWRCWFYFLAALGTGSHCQRYQKLIQWPWCYCAWLARKAAWPEPHRKSMKNCQEKDEETRSNNADDLKATNKTTWASITAEQKHWPLIFWHWIFSTEVQVCTSQIFIIFEVQSWNTTKNKGLNYFTLCIIFTDKMSTFRKSFCFQTLLQHLRIQLYV